MIYDYLTFRNVNLAEGDCFNHSFLYLLKTLPREEVVHPFLEEAAEKPVKELSIMFAPFLEAMKQGLTHMKLPGIDIQGRPSMNASITFSYNKVQIKSVI